MFGIAGQRADRRTDREHAANRAPVVVDPRPVGALDPPARVDAPVVAHDEEVENMWSSIRRGWTTCRLPGDLPRTSRNHVGKFGRAMCSPLHDNPCVGQTRDTRQVPC